MANATNWSAKDFKGCLHSKKPLKIGRKWNRFSNLAVLTALTTRSSPKFIRSYPCRWWAYQARIIPLNQIWWTICQRCLWRRPVRFSKTFRKMQRWPSRMKIQIQLILIQDRSSYLGLWIKFWIYIRITLEPKVALKEKGSRTKWEPLC